MVSAAVWHPWVLMFDSAVNSCFILPDYDQAFYHFGQIFIFFSDLDLEKIRTRNPPAPFSRIELKEKNRTLCLRYCLVLDFKFKKIYICFFWNIYFVIFLREWNRLHTHYGSKVVSALNFYVSLHYSCLLEAMPLKWKSTIMRTKVGLIIKVTF